MKKVKQFWTLVKFAAVILFLRILEHRLGHGWFARRRNKLIRNWPTHRFVVLLNPHDYVRVIQMDDNEEYYQWLIRHREEGWVKR